MEGTTTSVIDAVDGSATATLYRLAVRIIVGFAAGGINDVLDWKPHKGASAKHCRQVELRLATW
jgi:hypothetical protein